MITLEAFVLAMFVLSAGLIWMAVVMMRELWRLEP